jgi:hypothetical protein
MPNAKKSTPYKMQFDINSLNDNNSIRDNIGENKTLYSEIVKSPPTKLTNRAMPKTRPLQNGYNRPTTTNQQHLHFENALPNNISHTNNDSNNSKRPYSQRNQPQVANNTSTSNDQSSIEVKRSEGRSQPQKKTQPTKNNNEMMSKQNPTHQQQNTGEITDFMKYKIKLYFETDIDEKYKCPVEAYKELKRNFEEIKGPLRTTKVDNRTIMVTGESHSDLQLLKTEWLEDAFEIGIEYIDSHDENNRVMLTAKILNEPSEAQLNYLKENYGVDEINKRGGGTRYDIIFENESSRSKALEGKYMMAGAEAIKVYEWIKKVSITQCYNCQGFNHYGNTCDYDMLCKFCGRYEAHESRDCPNKNRPNHHICAICDTRGHFAGQRGVCPEYIKQNNKYLERQKIVHKAETVNGANNIQITNFIKQTEEKIENRNREIKEEVKNTVNGFLQLHKRILTDREFQAADFTVVAEECLGESCMEVYKRIQEQQRQREPQQQQQHQQQQQQQQQQSNSSNHDNMDN